MAESLQRNPITSCSFTWEDCGLAYIESVLCVKTRILSDEIQVRLYNGHGMIDGRIWPMSKQQSSELFGLLEQCNTEWASNDYSVFVCDGWSWELKISTKGKHTRTIKGTVDPPPRGREIRDMIAGIIGKESCYIFDSAFEEDEDDDEL